MEFCHQREHSPGCKIGFLHFVEASVLACMVEAMAIHNSLINKFPYIKASPFDRFLRWQRKHNPQDIA